MVIAKMNLLWLRMGVFMVLAAAVAPHALSAANQASAWDAFVNEFIEDHLAAHPSFAVQAGRHEFDGRLPDWRPEALDKEIERLKSARRQAVGFDAASLDPRQRFECDYLLSLIDKELFWLDTARWPYKNPMYYSGALDPNVYITRNYAPLAERMRAYIAYAEAVPMALEQIRNNIKTPLPRSYIDIGKTVFGGLAEYYQKDIPAVFAEVDDRSLRTAFKAATGKAVKAMEALVAWLDAQRATDDFAMGADLFQKMLWETERVKVPLPRLEQVGREDLERNLAALRKACDAYAEGKALHECVAKVQTVKPKDAVAGARRQLDALKRFLIAKDLVTIPGPEQALVAESPPYARWNIAYIDIPGPFDKGLPSIYYIAPPDPAWSEAERLAYVPSEAYLLFITVHEVWPGHFLQYLHSNRSTSKFGQLFVGYAFSEGWAHYTEELMWEVGLDEGDPKTQVGQLLGALKRNVRYLSAIGLHTEGMTLEESERLFREFAYQDPGNARQQAARGTFDPAYLNYTLGKLMIRKLREEWTAPRGGRRAWRAFHDRFLSYGGPPIPLIHDAMLGPNAGPAL